MTCAFCAEPRLFVALHGFCNGTHHEDGILVCKHVIDIGCEQCAGNAAHTMSLLLCGRGMFREALEVYSTSLQNERIVLPDAAIVNCSALASTILGAAAAAKLINNSRAHLTDEYQGLVAHNLDVKRFDNTNFETSLSVMYMFEAVPCTETSRFDPIPVPKLTFRGELVYVSRYGLVYRLPTNSLHLDCKQVPVECALRPLTVWRDTDQFSFVRAPLCARPITDCTSAVFLQLCAGMISLHASSIVFSHHENCDVFIENGVAWVPPNVISYSGGSVNAYIDDRKMLQRWARQLGSVAVVDTVTNKPLTLADINLSSPADWLRAFFAEMQSRRTPIFLKVRREFLLSEVSVFWQHACADDVFAPFRVSFEGEPAVDGGTYNGLCSELFTAFTEQFLHRFVNEPSMVEDGLCRGFGCLMFKSLIESRPIDLSTLSSTWLKVIVGEPLPSDVFERLRCLDLQRYRTTMTILRTSSTEGLFWPDSGAAVTKSELVRYMTTLTSEFCNSIVPGLMRISEGFRACVNLTNETVRGALNPEVCMSLLIPAVPINAQNIVKRLAFEGWSGDESTPYFLCSWLHNANQYQLKLFLRWCTGLSLLPPNDNRIHVQHDEHHFASKTCFWQLHLPSFRDFDALDESMNVALRVLEEDHRMSELVDA